MKNILLVSTGGTIGSVVRAGSIDTACDTQLKLVQLFRQHETGMGVQFHCIQPLQLLSENLAARAWQTLIAAIEAEQPEKYDGVIVTHGTDTLAYTAAALSFYFHALPIPLLLVSSDYPLDDTRANGLDNFCCAVAYICQNLPAGVFVPYRNVGQTMQLHQGSRLACSLQLSSDFISIQNKPFMQFASGQFTLCHAQQRVIASSMQLQARFSERVLMIKPYPSLNYQHIYLAGVDAVLHDLYHSGTACATDQWGEPYSLVTFIQYCATQGVSVYLAPILYSDEAYQSTRLLIEQGAKPLWNLSIEAAYVKLLLAYGNFNTEQAIMAFVNTPIAAEQC